MVRSCSASRLKRRLWGLVTGLLLLASIGPVTAQVIPGFTVSGSVRRDADGNGDPTDPDTPMAGVVLRLFTDPNADGNPADGTEVAATATDISGSYQFVQIPNGNYVIVQFDPPGSLSTYDPQGSLTDSRAAITLNGSDLSDQDFLDFGAFLYGITGTAFADGPLNDALFGPDDLPVSAVITELFADLNANNTVDPGEPLITETATSPTGRFGFGGLVSGAYVVRQVDPPGALPVNDSQGLPNDNLAAVTISSADVTGVQFLDQGITLGALSGTVRLDEDADGNPADPDPPLPGVILLLFTDPNADGNPFDGYAVTQTATDLAGHYSFPNLPAGAYVVFQFDSQGGSSTWDAVGSPTDSVVSATLSGSNISGLDFRDSGSLIGIASGVVFEDGSNQNAQFSSDDLGTAGVVIELYADLDSNRLVSDDDVYLGQTSSRLGGAFSIPHLAYGYYVARQDTPGDAEPVNDLDGSPTDATIGFELASSEFQSLLFLNQGLNIASISGAVRNDADGDGDPADADDPLPNVTVRLFSDPNADGDPADGQLLGSTVTNSSGQYVLQGLVPAAYVVQSLDVLGATSTYDAQGSLTDNRIAVSLSGTAVTGRDFLDTGALLNRISGQVFNDGPTAPGLISPDDTPLPAVFLNLYADVNGNGAADNSDILLTTVATGLDGAYSFPPVPAGRYVVFELDPPGSTSVFDVQGGPIDNTIAVELAGSDIAGRDFLDAGVTFRTVSGQVRDDADLDGNITDPDQPVPGATIRLYIDLGSDGLLTAADRLIGSAVTGSDGLFSFGGLPAGSYLLEEIDPPGVTASTGDSQGANDNLVGIQVTFGDDSSAVFLDDFTPTGHLYDSVTGLILSGGSVSVSGPGVVTRLLDGSSGRYFFLTDGTAGLYTLTVVPPPGFIAAPSHPAQPGALDPTGQPSPFSLGSGESSSSPGSLSNTTAAANPFHLQFQLSAGDPLVVNNNIPLVRVDPPTFAYWSAATPGAGGSATADLDSDQRPDLLEYAFQTDPQNGVSSTTPHGVVYNATTGRFEAFYTVREQGRSDVSVQIQLLADLGNSPAGWSTAVTTSSPVSNGDGTRTFRIPDLAAEPVFQGRSQGFVRFRVALDADANGTPESVVATPVEGWHLRSTAAGIITWSAPLVRTPLLQGRFDSVTGSSLGVTTALGGLSLSSVLPAATEFFVEILDGTHAGHRLDLLEASSTGSALVIDTSSTLNTLGSLPSTLTGAAFALRAHLTLAQAFPPAFFSATNAPSTADRALLYSNTTKTFTNFWLFLNAGNPRWVREGDATLASRNGQVINAAQGVMVQKRSGLLSLPSTGQVRSSDFVLPLQPGQNLVATPWPLSQSPLQRAMTVAGGYTGAANAANADAISVWAGDTTAGASGYATYFLLQSGPIERWALQGDATLANRSNELLFISSRAVFIKSIPGMPALRLTCPWTP